MDYWIQLLNRTETNNTDNKFKPGLREWLYLYLVIKESLLENGEILAKNDKLEKVSYHSNNKERQCQRMFKKTTQLYSSYALAKWCSRFSKPGFNNMWTMNFQMFKLDLEKAEEPEVRFPTSIRSSKKRESSRKTSTTVWLTTTKPLIVWITTHCGKFFKRLEYQTTLSASWEVCMQVKKAAVRTGG